ncbi:MAG TPA: NUDIX hydrolase [Bosea sp. (in: a-proteobacteria)]|jgi:8-oxo-dGTP pyrophosphatase MutT (NUDIX family)|uniref:NUDIX hydrolase n=1 Tax=Bosea sp. (in: a-proteobacteria) TaxID=1871050 RepID=UPI002E148431|nr:NUDIX hydrolase [Bosea sp. (in: a-proteobacteria)]
MKKAGKKGGRTRAQIAAMPVRLGLDGSPEILLITSRTTRRWIVPKGWRMKDRNDAEAAAIEAYEEAGVIGRVSETPAGRYSYWKRMADHFALCEVTLYLLEVERQLDSWAEKDERHSQWFKLEDAADLVDEPELATAIRNLPPIHLATAACAV